MASGCISITVITVLSMFSLVVCKPFLGDLLARAIASSSTPDDPQSHISDFRNMTTMDVKVGKLKVSPTAGAINQTIGEENAPELTTESATVATPASTLWQRWNRTEFLARIIDDILKPAQERITLVFQTLVARDGGVGFREKEPQPNISRADFDHRLNSTGDNDSDEIGSDLEQETEPELIDHRSMNDSTLLSQFQARRDVLRRRVAKALSSITGLLILAANTRREGKTRSTRSIGTTDNVDVLSDDRYRLLDLPNDIEPYDEGSGETTVGNGSNGEMPRRNAEAFGIFILEVFGSIAGFSWGIFKQVQSFFW